MQGEQYKPGDLVEVLCDRTHSSDQLTTAFTCSDGGIRMYESIDIHGYPGYDEFTGGSTEVLPKTIATVMQYIGRPSRIRRAFDCWEYDVYEVLVNGMQVQMFSNNMKPVNVASE